MFKTLMNGTAYGRVMSSFGEVGDSGGGGGEGDQGGGDSGDQGGDGQDENPEITDGKGFDLNAFWNEEEKVEKKDPPSDDQNPSDKPDPRQAEAAAKVKEMIEGISVAEDMIPENFDPTDPKQFRDVLGSVLQNQAGTVLQAVFHPLQQALQQQQENLVAYINEAIRENHGDSTARTLLESEIDIAGDPKFKPVVDFVFNQAKERAKGNHKDAVDRTKRALTAMGIEFKPAKRTGSDEFGNRSTSRSGDAALNLFAPLPPVPMKSRQQMRRQT